MTLTVISSFSIFNFSINAEHLNTLARLPDPQAAQFFEENKRFGMQCSTPCMFEHVVHSYSVAILPEKGYTE